MRRGRGAAVALTLLVLLVSSTGQARTEDMPAECRTRTERPFGEIAFSLDGELEIAMHGLEIQPGETLCVTGDLSKSHWFAGRRRFENLRVVDSSQSGEPFVEITMSQPADDGTTQVSVRNQVQQDAQLTYYLFLPISKSKPDLLIPYGKLRVAGEALQWTFRHAPARVVLTGFEMHPIELRKGQPSSDSAIHRMKRHGSKGAVGLGLGGGVRQFDFSELGSALSRNGYTLPRGSAITPGVAAWVEAYGFRLDLILQVGGLGDLQHVGGQTSSAWFAEYGADIGYRLFRRELSGIYPFVGVRSTTIHLRVPTEEPPIQPELFGAFNEPRTVEKTAYSLSLGLGVEHVLWPRHVNPHVAGLTVGARIAYMRQFRQTSWSLVHERLDEQYGSAPLIDASGFSLVLSLGAAIFAVPNVER